LAASNPAGLFGRALAAIKSKTAKPVVISSNNGNYFKNGGKSSCVENAFAMMVDRHRKIPSDCPYSR